MDHWLTFRGLPTEGLVDFSHEAGSPPIHRDGTNGVPGWLLFEVLSLSARGVSDSPAGLLGRVLVHDPL